MISQSRVRAFHQWKMRQLAARQRGFIINPYPFVAAATDPDFSSVISLLHLDGTNGSTTYIDVIGKTWANVSGGTASLDTSNPKFGTAALNTAGSALGIKTADHADWDFGSGDFTIECWAYNSFNSADVLVNKKDAVNFSPFQMLKQADESVIMRCSTDGTTYGASITSSAGVAAINNWLHWAFCRSGGTIYGFVSGSSIGTASISGALTTNSDGVTLGSADTSVPWWGMIDDFRVTKGVARYTSGFSPPVAAFPDS